MRLKDLKEWGGGGLLPSQGDAGIRSLKDVLDNDPTAKRNRVNHDSGSTAPGTYAGVQFDAATLGAFTAYMTAQNVPNPVSQDKLHTTLLHSKKNLPKYEAAGQYSSPMLATPTNLEVWPSQPDENGETSNVLVQRFDCPDLEKRHTDLMGEHDAQYDFDEYIPHITLSYDVGDLTAEDLEPFNRPINVVSEYSEELKTQTTKGEDE